MPFENTRCAFNNSLGLCAAVCRVDGRICHSAHVYITWYCFSRKLGSYRLKDSIMICLEFLTMVFSKRMYLSKYSTLEVKSSLNWK